MKISVIMAAWNAERTIGAAVESFLAQDHPERELIVIDGASTDRTRAIVEGFASPLIRLVSEPDRGIYDAMNKGLARVTGEGFGCLNADDCYARPDALRLIAAGLGQADLVSGTLHFVREHDGGAPVRVWRPAPFRKGAHARGYSLPHPTTYARRRVLERVGPFRTDLRSAADYDWLLRALEIEGFGHALIDAPLVNMRLGGESTAGLGAVLRNARELAAVRRDRLGARAPDLALLLNLVTKLRQRLVR